MPSLKKKNVFQYHLTNSALLLLAWLASMWSGDFSSPGETLYNVKQTCFEEHVNYQERRVVTKSPKHLTQDPTQH